MRIKDMTLEEKVDELLKYQRRIHHAMIVRAVIGVLMFLFIVILPLWGIHYALNQLGLSLAEIGDTLEKVQTLTDFDTLKSLFQ